MKSLEYNTQLRPLVLAEYGRNVQHMVEYCLGIEDREERTLCAMAIVGVMRKLTPQQANTPEKEQKLWDHLAIISDFQLDVDSPLPMHTKEEIMPAPIPLSRDREQIHWRHCGRNIQQMVQVVADLEDGPYKDALISMIAHHMKKLQFVHNKEGVDDAKILRDLAIYSNGKIQLDPETYLLHEFREEPQPTPAKRGRKKKK